MAKRILFERLGVLYWAFDYEVVSCPKYKHVSEGESVMFALDGNVYHRTREYSDVCQWIARDKAFELLAKWGYWDECRGRLPEVYERRWLKGEKD